MFRHNLPKELIDLQDAGQIVTTNLDYEALAKVRKSFNLILA